TRLTVIDKLPAENAAVFPEAPGVAPDVATLIGWLAELPARLPVDPGVAVPGVLSATRPAVPRTVRGYVNCAARAVPAAPLAGPDGVPLAYE
ncbi:hypothetical protein, partial [Pseudomonas syringae group genomosp. 7]|uniref:hypothetical protein n=1 Tax=Pseudomonas syringae group genomosp. 7 TaxID=251699 RepID=UPI00376FA3EE